MPEEIYALMKEGRVVTVHSSFQAAAEGMSAFTPEEQKNMQVECWQVAQ